MSFATDANILIYAVHRESEYHVKAKSFIEARMAGPELWVIPWTVIHAFMRIATHTGVFPNPLSPAQATSVIDSLAALPHVQFIGEGPNFWNDYKAGILRHQSRGNAIPDTLIALTLLAHGVTTLYTKDRDFRRYEGLNVIDPFG